MIVALSAQTPEMLLSILQSTGQTPQARTIWPQTSTVLEQINLVYEDMEVTKSYDQRSFQERKMTKRIKRHDLRAGRRSRGGNTVGHCRVT